MPINDDAHEAWLLAEARQLIAFGARSRLAAGGFGLLGDRGGLPHGDRAELYVTSRMTHAFAIAQALGWPGAAELVDHGLEGLQGRFRDDAHGGWYAAVDGDGAADPTKAAYAHAFVVLAAASATIAGRPSARALLDDALDVVTDHFVDTDDGRVHESWDHTFTTPEAYRGLNANMHMVEAYLAAADATGDTRWLDATVGGARLVQTLGREHDWRLPEHFTASWDTDLDHSRDRPADPFRPYGSTVGHSFEWARLLLTIRAGFRGRDRHAPDGLLDAARALFDRAVVDGWAVDGADGFVYTVDFAGEPVVRQRMHWVLCEAIAAAAVLHAETGDLAYQRWERTWWDHAESAFIDRDGGSWWHELGPDLRPARTVWDGKPDIYHALQATLIPLVEVRPSLVRSIREAAAAGRLRSG
jgi:mannose/cellobiose epimerase-like protein (N-acyl-D-glucosamine 2-epimerase family)